MLNFIVSLNKGFGSVSIESNDEKEIIDNIKRLHALSSNLEEILGADISLSQNIIDCLENFEYTDRILVLLNYGKKPLSRQDCKKRNQILKIPDSWWVGSNFSRNLKKKQKLGLLNIIENERPKYQITDKGKKYVKQLLINK